MGIILMLIIGGILGWLASIIMRTDAQQGIILNVVVGIVGALLGRFPADPVDWRGIDNHWRARCSLAARLVSGRGNSSCHRQSLSARLG